MEMLSLNTSNTTKSTDPLCISVQEFYNNGKVYDKEVSYRIQNTDRLTCLYFNNHTYEKNSLCDFILIFSTIALLTCLFHVAATASFKTNAWQTNNKYSVVHKWHTKCFALKIMASDPYNIL